MAPEGIEEGGREGERGSKKKSERGREWRSEREVREGGIEAKVVSEE
jgi:hypothetical protein